MQVVTHYFSSVGFFNLCIFSMLIVMVASRSLLRMEQIPATFFNHDCVPNTCRFKYEDSTNDDYGHNSTGIVIRLIKM